MYGVLKCKDNLQHCVILTMSITMKDRFDDDFRILFYGVKCMHVKVDKQNEWIYLVIKLLFLLIVIEKNHISLLSSAC